MNSDLGALVCRIWATDSFVIHNHMGEALQQLILSAINHVNPRLADLLHDKSGHQVKAYSVSSLHKPESDGVLMGDVRANDEAWLRLVGLQADVVAALDEFFVQSKPANIEIDRHQWELIEATWQNHPWAGTTSYQPLLLHFHNTEPTQAIEMRFVTPTAFRSNGLDVPLPILRSIFGSLERQWRELSGFSLPRELNAFIDYFLCIQQVELMTETLHLQGEDHVGFRGKLAISIQGSNNRLRRDAKRYAEADALDKFLREDQRRLADLARAVGLLSAFGFYTGVGKKTTQGMGMVGLG